MEVTVVVVTTWALTVVGTGPAQTDVGARSARWRGERGTSKGPCSLLGTLRPSTGTAPDAGAGRLKYGDPIGTLQRALHSCGWLWLQRPY